MGLPNEVNSALIGAAAAGTYEIEQSLRFDGSAYLSRSLSTTANYTMSVWVKFAKESNTDGIIGHRSSSSAYKQIFKEGSGYDSIGADNTGSTYAYSNNKCRDFGAWYHIVVSHGSSASSKIYINGEEVSYRLQTGTSGGTTSSATYYIGALWNAASPFNGYMAEVQAVESTELPTAFGEYDGNGVWRPIEYSGSYGSSGYYLKFDPSAANGIGHDHSGNGNNFTATGFDTSGSTGSGSSDVVTDSPTNNFAVLNPLMKRQDRDLEDCVKEGGLRFKKGDGNNQYIASSIACPGSGKWYFEFTVNVHGLYVGVAERGTWENVEGISTKSVLLQMDSSSNYYIRNYYTSATQNLSGESSTGQVYSMRYDADNGTVAFYNASGTQFGSTVTGLTTGVERFIFISGQSGADSYCNFGQQDWAHTLPTGYKALNTSNLPAPDIADGSDYFQTVLYTGNGSNSNAITGVGFQPDLVWGKCRSTSTDHYWVDSVRGVTKVLRSNVYNPEYTQSDSLVSFDSDGFTLDDDNSGGPSGNFNINSRTYVAWNWLKGASQGFNIVTWSGAGSSTQSQISHGLGVKPAMVIMMARTQPANYNHYVWHQSLPNASSGTNTWLRFDKTNAQETGQTNGPWGTNGTNFNSTTFSVGNEGNHSSATYVAYCFAEVEGYSKFGSYTGNGNSDGTFVYTGFKPSVIMIKSYSETGEWQIVDTTRSTYNPTQSTQTLEPHDSGGESSFTSRYWNGDILSNGWKYRGTQQYNATNRKYVFMAFADNPFGGDGVSPATAR